MSSTAKKYTFRIIGSGHEAGDERSYDVSRQGRHLGIVEPFFMPVGEREGDFAQGWYFRGNDGSTGEGLTRGDAVYSRTLNGSPVNGG